MRALKAYAGSLLLIGVLIVATSTPASAQRFGEYCTDYYGGSYIDIATNGMACKVTTWYTYCLSVYMGSHTETECYIGVPGTSSLSAEAGLFDVAQNRIAVPQSHGLTVLQIR